MTAEESLHHKVRLTDSHSLAVDGILSFYGTSMPPGFHGIDILNGWHIVCRIAASPLHNPRHV